jgi:hypothetical protein
MMTKRYFWMTAALWTIAVAAALVWNLLEVRARTVEAALIQARTACEKDLIYRTWNSRTGGVYVPVGINIRPNPHLESEKRDIRAGGLELTMVNPAYMTRMAHEIQNQSLGLQGHITSLKPIRPGNTPDPWEERALKELETNRSQSEVYVMQYDRPRPRFRFMRRLLVEEGCMKCHEKQGYKIGDIRGGISTTVPMELQLLRQNTQMPTLATGHGLLWMLGLVGFYIPYRKMGSSSNS